MGLPPAGYYYYILICNLYYYNILGYAIAKVPLDPAPQDVMKTMR
jgi:hypothetical protein